MIRLTLYFHYVLSLGAVFGIFAGFYYWFTKITGYHYNETLGQLHFWITFVGVNLTFFPMHFLGLSGMPRRIPDYPDGYLAWNTLSSWGSMISALGVVLFCYIIYDALSQEPTPVQDNVWYSVPETLTLEWTIPSPPPYHTFEEVPTIRKNGI